MISFNFQSLTSNNGFVAATVLGTVKATGKSTHNLAWPGQRLITLPLMIKINGR